MFRKVVSCMLSVISWHKYWLLAISYWLLAISCNDDDAIQVPKPKGYLRISFPERAYIKYDTNCPFTFEYPVYARVVPDELRNAEPCWINIEYPRFKAKIHLSYKKVDHNLADFTEHSRTFAVKHQLKASAIDEQIITKEKDNVYGLLYDIRGNTASSIQFYLTDSVRHFVRCALYFSAKPNADSLAPVIDFVSGDIERMVETFEWKEAK